MGVGGCTVCVCVCVRARVCVCVCVCTDICSFCACQVTAQAGPLIEAPGTAYIYVHTYTYKYVLYTCNSSTVIIIAI